MEIMFKMFLHFLLLLILLQFLFRVRRSRSLPPGPIAFPIIGNLIKFGDRPHRTFTELAKIYGPIISLKLGRLTTIVVSSPSMAEEILKKQDIAFSNRFIPDALRACDEDKFSVIWLPSSDRWRSLRKLAHSHILSPRVLDSNRHVRHKKVEELMAYVERCCQEGVAVNIGLAAFQTSLNVMSNTLFSVDMVSFGTNEVHDFKELIWNIMLAGKPEIVDFFPTLRPIVPWSIRQRMTIYFSTMLSMFSKMIDKKMATKTFLKDGFNQEDVMDVFLKISKENATQMDRKHMEHMCLGLFAAGTDTVSITLEWAMSELLRHPEVTKKLKNELNQIIGKGKQVEESHISDLPYLNAVIKETLRLHPPAPFLIPRQVNTEVELCGYTIPKGSQVLVNVWAIGRDPNYWKYPKEFMPDRFLDSKIDVRGTDFELIPFGGGRRICLGISLAMRILATMLGSLINSFDWKIDGEVEPENLDMDEKFGSTLQRASPLLVIPVSI